MVQKDLSIVIPVYNEEQSIRGLYLKLNRVLQGLGKTSEVIFVDDGSEDGTFEFLKKIKTVDEKVRVIRFRKNFGQTQALDAAFKRALGAVVVTMDGDLQNDPADIPALLRELDRGYDCVSGWRADRKDPLITKKLPSRISNTLARAFTGLGIHDFGCTLKAYRAEALENLVLYGEMHRYIPALLAWKGFSVSEIKVRHHPRKKGKTKYGTLRLFRGLLDLTAIKFLMTYSGSPLHFFGLLGLAQILLGTVFGSYLAALKLLYHQDIGQRPLLLLSILLLLMGVQFITLGFLSELVVRAQKAVGPDYAIKEVL